LLKAADVQSRRFGENHIEVVSTHTRIGGLWCSQKDYNKAMQSYLKVKEIYDFLFGNTDSRVALTLNKIGLAELARGDFDMAMNYLQEALRVQRINFRNLAPNEINPDASQTLVNIGSVYYKERNSFDKIQ
jgi:tetratricopeptide (TPR) repeat protein